MAENTLRRYTDLPVLHYLLRKQVITLRDPDHWEDKNDSYYLKVYEKRRKLRRVLALCFSQADETSHHWKMFAPGPSGVCICFDGPRLIEALEKQRGVKGGDVVYKTLKELRKKRPKVAALPFLKRIPYEGEEEYRFIFSSPSPGPKSLDIAISIDMIEKIYFNPWIDRTLFDAVKASLREIPGCEGLQIFRSTLMGNNEWKNFADEAVS